jgi:hypothetical protein
MRCMLTPVMRSGLHCFVMSSRHVLVYCRLTVSSLPCWKIFKFWCCHVLFM